MSDLARLSPEVRTLARPATVDLLAVRFEVQRNGALQALFVQARKEGWSTTQLVDAALPLLEAKLSASTEELRQAATYLADEYFQIGDAMLLIDRRTGKALVKITEEDIWQGPEVRRESGALAKPLPRLRPELEGMLVQWVFDRERDSGVEAALAARPGQTAFLAEEGNPRLRAATQEGRQAIVRDVREAADTILQGLRGLPLDFLNAFDVRTEDGAYPGSFVTREVAFARTRTNVADQRTVNLRFDLLAYQRGAIGHSWVREIVRSLAQAYPLPRKVDYGDLTVADLGGAPMWATNGHAMSALTRTSGVSVLVIESDVAIGLRPGKVGTLVLHPGTYDVRSREVHDRWEVAASVNYSLWVDWSRIVGLQIVNVPVQAVVVGL
jgi:hypothetical protein